LRLLLLAGLLVLAPACHDATAERSPPAAPVPVAAAAPTPSASPAGRQRGGGQPYEIVGSEVWDVPDPVSGRIYQVFITLPRSYRDEPDRRYPVLYATDAGYAFPLLNQITRRLNGGGPAIEEFILVGLSYAVGEDGMSSRRRDYTPSPTGGSGAPADATHGQGDTYLAYLRDQALPFVANRYRTDESRRHFLGHSYGALLGTQILFTQPDLFAGYILGSRSYWYDNHHMERREAAFATTHQDLQARVYMYVGQYEDTLAGDARYATRHDMVTDARRMVRTLHSREYPSLQVDLEVLDGEDHLSVAPRGFTRGLKRLLGTRGG
jgi:uncharacterized protein